MTTRISTRRAYFLLHLTVFLWGFTAILGKSISIQALPLVFYRLWITVGVIGIALAARRDGERVPAKAVFQLLGVGAFVALHWVLFYACIKLDGVAVAVLCLSSIGFFTAVFEPWVLGRPYRVYELALGALVVLGVILLVSFETHSKARGWITGIASALFSAAFGTLNGKFAQNVPAARLTFWELFGAAIVTSTFVLGWAGSFVAPWRLSHVDMALLAALAVACTALPWLFAIRVLRVLSPYTAALAVSLEPVYSMVFAALLWPASEKLSPRFYIGAALLIAVGPVNALLRRREVSRAIVAGGAREEG